MESILFFMIVAIVSVSFMLLSIGTMLTRIAVALEKLAGIAPPAKK